jgi:hypothetical protein
MIVAHNRRAHSLFIQKKDNEVNPPEFRIGTILDCSLVVCDAWNVRQKPQMHSAFHQCSIFFHVQMTDGCWVRWFIKVSKFQIRIRCDVNNQKFEFELIWNHSKFRSSSAGGFAFMPEEIKK